MKKVNGVFAVFSLFLVASCASNEQVVVPLNKQVLVDDTFTIIWHGRSEAYRYVDGQWQRAEAYDYQFDVVQKRYAKQWKSVKTLHRLHPDYDGRAGARDQTMYFELSYNQLENKQLEADIRSSLGAGRGATDPAFRQQQLVIDLADASRFMPYNRIKISQQYRYETGQLTETVELVKVENEKEIPFMKNEETASFYTKSKLNGPPNVYGSSMN
jgi:hypothetical protein